MYYFLTRLTPHTSNLLRLGSTVNYLRVLRHPLAMARTYASSSPVPANLIQKLNKEKKHSLLETALAHIQDNHPARAVDILNKITADDPEHTRAQNLLATVYIELKRYPEALKVNTELLKKEPNNINYKISYGQVLVLLGKLEEAKRFFKQIKLELIQNIIFNLGLRQEISEQTKVSLNAISQDKIPEKYNKLVEDFVNNISKMNEAFISSSEKSGLLALLRENAHEMVKDKIINGIQSAIPVHIMQRYEIVNSLLAEVYSAIIDGIKKRVEAETAPRPDNSNKHRP